ncbi:hypothetical protein QAD02_024460 [Eretmocerus hayati]|uniref:Uncharacterized protein n=2 Tax=Eretmocerus hayati TaxID=131215 RepID=A0ACC2MZW8_9HYME|nr:hypothetical protein QAD02_005883 [Eretmocerus hayati]KAJ8688665.1 hypothetical protein QAD02_024460 [Eretmocerus hayati]
MGSKPGCLRLKPGSLVEKCVGNLGYGFSNRIVWLELRVLGWKPGPGIRVVGWKPGLWVENPAHKVENRILLPEIRIMGWGPGIRVVGWEPESWFWSVGWKPEFLGSIPG